MPPNTTSQLQPLDLGIIQNFKVHYRRFLLRYVLSKIDECESASEVASEVSILVAIRWIAQAWKEVKAETICKCFSKAGILDVEMDVVSCDLSGEDPFSDIDENGDLQGLIVELMPENEHCTAQEYVNGDSELLTCDMDDGRWEEVFMSNLGKLNEETQVDEEAEDNSRSESPPKSQNHFIQGSNYCVGRCAELS